MKELGKKSSRRARSLMLSVGLGLFLILLVSSSNNPMIFAIVPEGGGGGDALVASKTLSGYYRNSFTGSSVPVHVSVSWNVYSSQRDYVKTYITIKNEGFDGFGISFAQDFRPFNDQGSYFSYYGYLILQGSYFVTYAQYNSLAKLFEFRVSSEFSTGDTVQVMIMWKASGDMPYSTYHFEFSSGTRIYQSQYAITAFWDPTINP